MPQTDVLAVSVSVFNSRLSPSDYSFYFLLFGTRPPEEEAVYSCETREVTQK